MYMRKTLRFLASQETKGLKLIFLKTCCGGYRLKGQGNKAEVTKVYHNFCTKDILVIKQIHEP